MSSSSSYVNENKESYLGSDTEFLDFTKNMSDELIGHKKREINLRDTPTIPTIVLYLLQIEDRIHEMRNALYDLDKKIIVPKSREIIKKQSICAANCFMLIFSKIEEDKKIRKITGYDHDDSCPFCKGTLK